MLRGADLKPFVDGNDFDPSSIAVCAMCRVSNGWVAKFDLACLPHASFGPAVPDLQALLRELPEVDASAVVVDRDTAVQPLPKVESLVVDAVLAAFHGKPREEIELPAVPKPHKKADEEEEEEEEAEEEDGEPEAPWPHAVRLVRVDLGWSGYPWFPPEKPKKEKPEGEESEEGEEAAEEEEEEEVEAPPEPECEVVCAVYNSKGEQLAVIDAGGDTDGIRAITDDDKKIKARQWSMGQHSAARGGTGQAACLCMACADWDPALTRPGFHPTEWHPRDALVRLLPAPRTQSSGRGATRRASR